MAIEMGNMREMMMIEWKKNEDRICVSSNSELVMVSF